MGKLQNAAALLKGLVDRSKRSVMIDLLHTLDERPNFECPCCGFVGQFKPWGVPIQLNVECPACGSAHRHRLFFLVQQRHQIIPADADLLHFAPEPFLRPKLEASVASYRSADLRPGAADIVLNIENIELPSNSVSAIMCSHVLEHVDDRKALPEMFRILKPGGRIVVMVPIIEGWEETYENPEIVSPADRQVHFSQYDHVRLYGRDLRDRIRAAGFELTEYTALGAEAVRYGLHPGDRVFLCTKPMA